MVARYDSEISAFGSDNVDWTCISLCYVHSAPNTVGCLDPSCREAGARLRRSVLWGMEDHMPAGVGDRDFPFPHTSPDMLEFS